MPAFIRLVIRNALRNRRRTLLTVTSVAISIFLLVSLQTLVVELRGDTLLSQQSERRLLTRSATSLAIPLPLAYKAILQRIDGVEDVSEYQWIPTYNKNPNMPLIVIACDADLMGTDPQLVVPPNDLAALRADRRGLLVPVKMMRKFGWKVGQRITFPGTVFPFAMEFTIRGTFTATVQNFMFCHFSYFNEMCRHALPSRADQSMAFIVRTASPEIAAKIATEIDQRFRNSIAPTHTESEKDFVLGFSQMLGNVRVLIEMIAIAVIFAIALVTTNTMSMAVRERTHEIAMLKAIGFTPRRVLALIITESLAVASGGALLGVVSARVFFTTFDIYDLTNGVVQHFQITTTSMGQGFALAVAMAVLSSVVPAWRGASRPIAMSLRQIG